MQYIVTIIHVVSISVSLFFIAGGIINKLFRNSSSFRLYICILVLLSVHNFLNTAVYYSMQFFVFRINSPLFVGDVVSLNLCLLLFGLGRLVCSLFSGSGKIRLVMGINRVLGLVYCAFLLAYNVFAIPAGPDRDVQFFDILVPFLFIQLIVLVLFLAALLFLSRKHVDHLYSADEHRAVIRMLVSCRIMIFIFAPGLILQIAKKVTVFQKISGIVDFISLVSFPVFMIVLMCSSMFTLLRYREPAKSPERGVGELGLSRREEQVVLEMIKGYSYSEIGDHLYISLQTVKTHLNSVYRKTGTRNKVELYNTVLNR